MGSKDTSSQEQQREAKRKRQRRKLCFCAHCKGLHFRRKYIRRNHMIKWGPSIASDDSSQDAPTLALQHRLARMFHQQVPHVGSL
ncbi:unnamed protein product, partial [Sphagnum troendelagicum]